jgi:hypothetical protein
MRKVVILTGLVVILVGSNSQNVLGDDKEKLEGVWRITSAEVQGKTIPAPEGSDDTWTFEKDGTITLKEKG